MMQEAGPSRSPQVRSSSNDHHQHHPQHRLLSCGGGNIAGASSLYGQFEHLSLENQLRVLPHEDGVSNGEMQRTTSASAEATSNPAPAPAPGRAQKDGFWYQPYRSERDDLNDIIRLVESELSEPYNIYTFRFFLVQWPEYTHLVYEHPESTRAIATILCKVDTPMYTRKSRGYIAMLSIEPGFRRRGIASHLVREVVLGMHRNGVHEVVVETESDNEGSLALYEKMGFVRDKRLHRFYSNGKDAWRLILALDKHKSPYPTESSLYSHDPISRTNPIDLATTPQTTNTTNTTMNGQLLLHASAELETPEGQLDADTYTYTDADADADADANENENENDADDISETASERSYGRWEVASGPDWLESLTEEEALLRGLGGEPGHPVPAPDGAERMLVELMRRKAAEEVARGQGQGQFQVEVQGQQAFDSRQSMQREEMRYGEMDRTESEQEREGEGEGERPDTPLPPPSRAYSHEYSINGPLQVRGGKPDLPPRPTIYDGMYT